VPATERESDYRTIRRPGRFKAVTADPLGLAGEVDRATDRLLARAAKLDDAAVAAPSALPDWTRAHVLTHLARNADGLVNLLTWARTGVETPQYASMPQRNADIEAGAGRPAAELLTDLTAACTRFAAAAAEMPAEAWTATVTWRTGRSAPAAHVMWARLSELEIHHVDLDAGYRPADWSVAFAARVLRGVVQDFGERPEGPRAVIRADDVGPDLPIGPGVTSPVVSGPAWAAAAWLIGRTRGEQLTVTPSGPLPPVPTWG
jgi:maleylpyruvate isomerase